MFGLTLSSPQTRVSVTYVQTYILYLYISYNIHCLAVHDIFIITVIVSNPNGVFPLKLL